MSKLNTEALLTKDKNERIKNVVLSEGVHTNRKNKCNFCNAE